VGGKSNADGRRRIAAVLQTSQSRAGRSCGGLHPGIASKATKGIDRTDRRPYTMGSKSATWVS
jgi:hypothetical protein